MNLEEYKVCFFHDDSDFGIDSIYCIRAGRDKLFQRQSISFAIKYLRKKENSEEKEYRYEWFFLFGDLKFYGTKENPVFTLTIPEGKEYLLSKDAIDGACRKHEEIEDYCEFNGETYIKWYWTKEIAYSDCFFITILKELDKSLSYYPNGHIIFEDPEFSQYFTNYELKRKVYNYNDVFCYIDGEPFCAYYITGKCEFIIESEKIPPGTKSPNFVETATDPYNPEVPINVEARYNEYQTPPPVNVYDEKYSYIYIKNVLNSLKEKKDLPQSPDESAYSRFIRMHQSKGREVEEW